MGVQLLHDRSILWLAYEKCAASVITFYVFVWCLYFSVGSIVTFMFIRDLYYIVEFSILNKVQVTKTVTYCCRYD